MRNLGLNFFKLDVVLLAISIIVVVFAGLLYFIYASETAAFSNFMLWYVSATATVALASISYWHALKVMRLTDARVLELCRRQKIDTTTHLSESVKPSIEACEGLPNVCEMAAGIINRAHKKKNHELRYVTFYGAASLAIPEGEIEDFGSTGGSGQQSPYQKYLGAIDAATGDKIRIRRYVRLFTDQEFSNRSQTVQREYLNWLKSQYNMLFRNPNYILVDVVRAPAWGSKMARIITDDALMEITGDGDAGILITDNNLCDTIRRAARETVVGTSANKNKPDYYGHSKRCEKKVEDFKKYFQNLEKVFSPKEVGDEETEA